jgi:hypothetical protein
VRVQRMNVVDIILWYSKCVASDKRLSKELSTNSAQKWRENFWFVFTICSVRAYSDCLDVHVFAGTFGAGES